jgi:4'-phosphopantetheinyl transferase
MLQILALKNQEKLDNQLFQEILSLINEDRQQKILKFYRWQDAQRSLLGDLLVRATLCEVLQIKNEDINIITSEMGKPFVENIPQSFFNISHSGDWIVGAFDSFPVGIDIEYMKVFDLNMTRSILTLNDYELMMQKIEGERLDYFYKCWTLSESYFKMLGIGMSIPLPSVNKLTEEAFFENYFIDENYILSVCSIHNLFPEHIIFTDIKKLLLSVR